ncbi:MAG: hypothetical protein ACOX0W_05980 [Sphaerochaetaceae bacterium]
MTFNEAKKHYFKTLQQYVPIVSRVHGGAHPEFLEVHSVFKTMEEKMKGAGKNRVDLEGEFSSLRTITTNYTVPSDVCESYEAVYKMLEELDTAYRNS